LKQIVIVIAALICWCCTNKDSTTENLSSAKSGSPVLGNLDTMVIYQERSEGSFHTVYIDRSDTSEAFRFLTDFSFSKSDSNTYVNAWRDLVKSKKAKFASTNTSDMPRQWLPVFKYKSGFYLYVPSDRGVTRRCSINDSSFVQWDMEGPYPEPLKRVKKLSRNLYKIELGPGRDSLNKEIRLFTIDINTKLTVFEFSSSAGKYFQLYVPLESADQFDLITHESNEKQPLFEFDKIDFNALIANMTR
jgi:hypothetical protein